MSTTATIGPVEAAQVCESAQQCIRRAKAGFEHLPGLIEKIIDTRAWEARTERGRVVKLGSLRELVTSTYFDGSGWDEDPAFIESLLKGHPRVLAKWHREMEGQQ